MTHTKRSAVLVLLVAGGFLGAVGAVLPWIQGLAATDLPGATKRVTVPGVSSIVGVGWLVLAAGVLVLCVAVELMVVGPRPALWSILALIGGLVIAAIGVYNLFRVTTLVPDLRTPEQKAFAGMINDESAVGLTYNAHAGFGLYVVVAGGVLAAIGALVWLFTDRRLDAAPEQPARPVIPGPLLAVGAIVGAIGAFLPWGEAKSSSSIDQVNQGLVASGAAQMSLGGVNQGNGGWLILGGALLALIAAVTLFDRGRALWAAVVGLLGGLVAATGSTPEQTGLNFEVSLSFGLYLVLVGAVLALSGAVIGLRANRG